MDVAREGMKLVDVREEEAMDRVKWRNGAWNTQLSTWKRWALNDLGIYLQAGSKNKKN